MSKYLLIALCAVAFTACEKKQSDDSKEMAEDENKDKFKETDIKDDTEFAVAATDGGMMEIKASEVALKNASSASLKQFAQTMITDHTKAAQELKSLAEGKQISIPTTISDDNQKKLDELAMKTGTEFDKEYCELMLKDHKHVVDAFKKEAEKGNDAELKSWASQTLPTLEHHLMMAEEAEKSVKK